VAALLLPLAIPGVIATTAVELDDDDDTELPAGIGVAAAAVVVRALDMVFPSGEVPTIAGVDSAPATADDVG
jgi:hypothetical protein